MRSWWHWDEWPWVKGQGHRGQWTVGYEMIYFVISLQFPGHCDLDFGVWWWLRPQFSQCEGFLGKKWKIVNKFYNFWLVCSKLFKLAPWVPLGPVSWWHRDEWPWVKGQGHRGQWTLGWNDIKVHFSSMSWYDDLVYCVQRIYILFLNGECSELVYQFQDV